MIKLFAHRGLVDEKSPQNSIESLKNAYKNNFRAVEFDIWFWQEKLVIIHDQPESSQANNLVQLQDYFLYENEMEYWLDFKNLDETNIHKALILLNKTIVEKSLNKEKLFFAPFITDYKKCEKILAKFKEIFGEDVQFVVVLEDIKNFDLALNFIKKNNIKYLSINHELLNNESIKKQSQIEIFAWTIKDKKRFRELVNLEVKNFATDIKL